jgi:hypothetical protein
MANTVLYALCIITIIIIGVLELIYFISKKLYFSNYLSKFNMIFTTTLIIDIGFRLINASRGDGVNSRDVDAKCKLQAFVLTLFDKFTIMLITSFSIILYYYKFSKKNDENDENDENNKNDEDDEDDEKKKKKKKSKKSNNSFLYFNWIKFDL